MPDGMDDYRRESDRSTRPEQRMVFAVRRMREALEEMCEQRHVDAEAQLLATEQIRDRIEDANVLMRELIDTLQDFNSYKPR